jgi:hypothetical protein
VKIKVSIDAFLVFIKRSTQVSFFSKNSKIIRITYSTKKPGKFNFNTAIFCDKLSKYYVALFGIEGMNVLGRKKFERLNWEKK